MLMLILVQMRTGTGTDTDVKRIQEYSAHAVWTPRRDMVPTGAPLGRAVDSASSADV